MFNLLKSLSDTYTWPVAARIPANGGKLTSIQFEAEFCRLDADAVETIRTKYINTINNRVKNTPIEDEFGDKELVTEVLYGIKAKDDSGKLTDVPEDIKANLLAVNGVYKTITNAFFVSINGEKAKN